MPDVSRTHRVARSVRALLALALPACLLGVLAPASGAAQGAPWPLVFTAVPDQDEARLIERYGRVAEHLQRRLGLPVRYLPVKNYSSAVTAFGNDEVQFGWFGGFTGLQARRLVEGSQAIAQGAEDAEFRTYLIASTRLGLEKSRDFPVGTVGRTFVFGARASTSGRMMPEWFIRKAFPGRTSEEVYARIGFSGEHSRTIQLVQNGTFDLGAVDYTVWNLDVKAGRVDPSRVAVVWESPTFPNTHWSVRGDVERVYGRGFIERLRQALIGMDDPQLLEPFGRTRFIGVTNEAFVPLVEAAKATGMLD